MGRGARIQGAGAMKIPLRGTSRYYPQPEVVAKAIRKGDGDLVRRWLALGPLNTFSDIEHGRLLKSALTGCDTRREEMIQLLLSHGVKPIWDGDQSPLLRCKTPAEIGLLLDAGADIEAREMWRHDKSLLLLVEERYIHWHDSYDLAHDMVRFLVSRGADIHAVGRHYNGERGTAETLTSKNIARWFKVYGVSERSCKQQEHHIRNFHFLKAVRVAGGWKAYARAPRVELARLRSLCVRGRASSPPVLERLFAAGVPNEVFWCVLSFWRSSREIFDGSEGRERNLDEDEHTSEYYDFNPYKHA